jgi:exonuclease SbcD
VPDAEQIAAAVREVNVAGAHVRVRWQVGEEERGSVDRDAIKRALGDAADIQLEGRVVPVVRSRAAGISRAASLQEKVRVWARATGSMDGPLIERLEALAHREPAQIANAILAGEEGPGRSNGHAPEEPAAPAPAVPGAASAV